MKAIIEDWGDMSVGIHPQRWEVDCPFPPEELEEHRDWFSDKIAAIYGEFTSGRLIITYYPNTLPEPYTYKPAKEDMDRWARMA